MNNNTTISIISIVLFVILMTIMYFIKNDGSGIILKCRDEPTQIVGQIFSYILSAIAFVLIAWYNGLFKKNNIMIIISLVIFSYILIPEILTYETFLGDPEIDCDLDYDINNIDYWKDVGFNLIRLIVSLIFFTLVSSTFGNDSASFKTGILGRKYFDLRTLFILCILVIVFLVLSSIYLINKCDERDSDSAVRKMMETKTTILIISLLSISLAFL